MAHKTPRTADGGKAPSVTQVNSVLRAAGLEGWNYMQGWAFGYEAAIDDAIRMGGELRRQTPPDPDWHRRYEKRDAAADAGTHAHLLVECHLKGKPEPPAPEGLSDEGLEKAESCYLAYLEWERAHKFEMVESELTLVSEEHRFGGTLDIGAVVGDLGIVDIKTSKDVYLSMRCQVAAYGQLWNENREDKVKGYHILRLGPRGDFTHHYYPSLEKEWQIFLHCLGIKKLVTEMGEKL